MGKRAVRNGAQGQICIRVVARCGLDRAVFANRLRLPFGRDGNVFEDKVVRLVATHRCGNMDRLSKK